MESYPKSERADEIAYLGAKSYYYLSPAYSRDQSETYDALEKLQLFINKYPDSKYFDDANALIQELDLKLEKKAYEIALQYNTTGPFHRDYNSAITALNSMYPWIDSGKIGGRWGVCMSNSKAYSDTKSRAVELTYRFQHFEELV